MREINKGAKTGILIEIIAGIIMAALVIASKPIPTLVAWLFVVGLIIALVSSFIALKKENPIS